MVSPVDRTKADRRSPSRWTLGLALLAAATVHIPLAFTVWTARLRYATPNAPTIDLQLYRSSPWGTLRPEARSAAPRAPSPPPSSPGNPTSATMRTKPVPSPPAPATPPAAISSIAQPRPTPSAASAAEAPTGLSRALRSTLGCATPDLAGLTTTEREACQRRLAADYARTGDAVFGIDPERQASFDASRKTDSLYQMMQQGYLAERPTRGCKPVTAHEARVAPLGAKEGWSLRLGCAVPF
jgi:hypothetical protein